jgi:hypothetical protein
MLIVLASSWMVDRFQVSAVLRCWLSTWRSGVIAHLHEQETLRTSTQGICVLSTQMVFLGCPCEVRRDMWRS